MWSLTFTKWETKYFLGLMTHWDGKAMLGSNDQLVFWWKAHLGAEGVQVC